MGKNSFNKTFEHEKQKQIRQMGLHRIKIFLHSKENNQLSAETSYSVGENICKL
jgi:hypothetical protein